MQRTRRPAGLGFVALAANPYGNGEIGKIAPRRQTALHAHTEAHLPRPCSAFMASPRASCASMTRL